MSPGTHVQGQLAADAASTYVYRKEFIPEIRSPLTQALSPLKARSVGPGRGGDPRRFLSPGTMVQAQHAASKYGFEIRSPLEQVSPGRGRNPPRLLSPGTQVHDQQAAWAVSTYGQIQRVHCQQAALKADSTYGNWKEPIPKIRSPLEQMSPGRGRDPQETIPEIRSPLEQVSPGRGRDPPRLLSPGT